MLRTSLLRWLLTVLTVSLLQAPPLLAQQGGAVVFRTEPSRTTSGLRDALEVTYTIMDVPRLSSLLLEPNADFEILRGYADRQSAVTDMTPSGPVQSTTISRTYTLQPRHTGKLSVPTAVARTSDGRSFRSNSVQVNIISGSAPSARGSSSPDPFGGQQQPGSSLPDPFAGLAQGMLPPGFDPWERVVPSPGRGGLPSRAELPRRLFLEILPDKKTAYVGEPVTVRYRLTGSVNASGSLTKLPTPDGFWVQDLPSENTAPVDTSVRGQYFQSLLLKRAAFIPQHSGSISIDPAELDATTDIATGNGIEQTTIHLRSEPVTLSIRPLPAGAPTGFAGAVGNFHITAGLSHNRIGKDGSALFTVTFSGTGNLTQLEAPLVRFPVGISAEDPAIQDALEPDAATLTGKRSFQFTLTASETGRFTIPPIRFSFFDPSRNSYQTLQTESQTLEVASAGLFSRNGSEEGSGFSGWIIGGTAALLAGLALLFLAFRKRRKPAPASPKRTAPPPRPVAAAPLPEKQPEQPAVAPPPTSLKEILPELRRSLDATLGDGSSYLPSDAMRRKLENKGWSVPEAADVTRLLSAVEGSLYGGASADSDGLLMEAQALWTRLKKDRA